MTGIRSNCQWRNYSYRQDVYRQETSAAAGTAAAEADHYSRMRWNLTFFVAGMSSVPLYALRRQARRQPAEATMALEMIGPMPGCQERIERPCTDGCATGLRPWRPGQTFEVRCDQQMAIEGDVPCGLHCSSAMWSGCWTTASYTGTELLSRGAAWEGCNRKGSIACDNHSFPSSPNEAGVSANKIALMVANIAEKRIKGSSWLQAHS